MLSGNGDVHLLNILSRFVRAYRERTAVRAGWMPPVIRYPDKYDKENDYEEFNPQPKGSG